MNASKGAVIREVIRRLRGCRFTATVIDDNLPSPNETGVRIGKHLVTSQIARLCERGELEKLGGRPMVYREVINSVDFQI